MYKDAMFFILSGLLTLILVVIFGYLQVSSMDTECKEVQQEQVKPNGSTASSGYYETMPIIKDVTTSKKWI